MEYEDFDVAYAVFCYDIFVVPIPAAYKFTTSTTRPLTDVEGIAIWLAMQIYVELRHLLLYGERPRDRAESRYCLLSSLYRCLSIHSGSWHANGILRAI